MSFERRFLDLEFQLGEGSFGAAGYDTVSLTGLRTRATITKAGGVSMSQLQLRVQGMTLSTMNRLSTLGKPLVDGRNNRITVSARTGDAAGAVAFTGTISEAWVDMDGAPDGVFMVSAFTGLIDALKPIPPSSFPAAANVADIMQGLATQMGVAFENNGVSEQLAQGVYLPGTAWQQVQTLARDGNINMVLDDGILAVWPKDGSRGGVVPLISPGTGLVGYPTHTENGIAVRTVYNPALIFGGQVDVESSLTPATGRWTIFSVAHELEAEAPGGAWFTQVQCSVLGHAQPLPR